MRWWRKVPCLQDKVLHESKLSRRRRFGRAKRPTADPRHLFFLISLASVQTADWPKISVRHRILVGYFVRPGMTSVEYLLPERNHICVRKPASARKRRSISPPAS